MLGAGLASGAVATEPVLEICIDQRPWFPMTFSAGGEALGVHVDVVRCALDAAGFDYRFRSLPWARCMLAVGTAELDAVATASYTEARAATLLFPEDAALADHSRWAVGYADELIVTPAGSGYVFRGDWATLPQPLRVPRGYGVAEALRARGIAVDLGAASDEDDFRKLVRDRSGAAIANSISVRAALRDPEFASRLEVQSMPLRALSYHLAFSRASARLDGAARQRIWDQIALIRDNAQLQAGIESRYAGVTSDDADRMPVIPPLDCGSATTR